MSIVKVVFLLGGAYIAMQFVAFASITSLAKDFMDKEWQKSNDSLKKSGFTEIPTTTNPASIQREFHFSKSL